MGTRHLGQQFQTVGGRSAQDAVTVHNATLVGVPYQVDGTVHSFIQHQMRTAVHTAGRTFHTERRAQLDAIAVGRDRGIGGHVYELSRPGSHLRNAVKGIVASALLIYIHGGDEIRHAGHVPRHFVLAGSRINAYQTDNGHRHFAHDADVLLFRFHHAAHGIAHRQAEGIITGIGEHRLGFPAPYAEQHLDTFVRQLHVDVLAGSLCKGFRKREGNLRPGQSFGGEVERKVDVAHHHVLGGRFAICRADGHGFQPRLVPCHFKPFPFLTEKRSAVPVPLGGLQSGIGHIIRQSHSLARCRHRRSGDELLAHLKGIGIRHGRMGIPQVYGLYLHLIFLSGLEPLDGNHLTRGFLVICPGNDRYLAVSAVQR